MKPDAPLPGCIGNVNVPVVTKPGMNEPSRLRPRRLRSCGDRQKAAHINQ